MDEKAIFGFIIWLFPCLGFVTVFTTPENTLLACTGNIIGLGLMMWVLRRPSVREILDRPELTSLILVMTIVLAGIVLAWGLGRLAVAW